MKIKRYRLKDDVTCDRIKEIPGIRCGGAFVNQSAVMVCFRTLCKTIDIAITFPEDLSKWNDEDYILVLDDEFGQPYIPFYRQQEHPERTPFEFMMDVIHAYHACLENFGIFESVE